MLATTSASKWLNNTASKCVRFHGATIVSSNSDYCQKTAWMDYVALEEAYLLSQIVNNQQGAANPLYK